MHAETISNFSKQPDTSSKSAFQQPKPNIAMSSPLPSTQTKFSFTSNTQASSPLSFAKKSQETVSNNLFPSTGDQKALPKSATVSSISQAASSSFSLGTKTLKELTAPNTPSIQSSLSSIPQSSSLFPFNLGGQSSSQTSLISQKPQQIQLKQTETQQKQQPPPVVESLIKNNSNPSEPINELNKTITISSNIINKEKSTEAATLNKLESSNPIEASVKSTSNASSPQSNTLQNNNAEIIQAQSNKQSDLDTLLPVPRLTSTTQNNLQNITNSQVSNTFSFGFGNKSTNGNNQINTSFSFGNSLGTSQQTATTTLKSSTPATISNNTNSLISVSTSVPVPATPAVTTSSTSSANVSNNTEKNIQPLYSDVSSHPKEGTPLEPANIINSTPVATLNTTVLVPPATPGPAQKTSTSFLFGSQNKPSGAFSFGSSSNPTTSTPNHQSNAASSVTTSQVTGTSLFSSFIPQANPFSAVAAQSTPLKSAGNQNEIDTDMEAAANGASFSNLGFGGSSAPKLEDQANKNIFGGSLFSSLTTPSSTIQAVQQKSPFGAGILKNPTFTIGNQPTQSQQPTGLFGNTSNTLSGGTGLFSSSSTAAPTSKIKLDKISYR